MANHRKSIFWVLAVCALALSFSLPVSANQETAREEVRSLTERQARAELESLIARLCPGRCELVSLNVVVDEARPVGQVTPGFEGPGGGRFEADVRRIEATVLLDSNLPESFRRNLPRMAQFRLQELAPVVEIRPEMLAFPDPQLPPMPDAPVEPLRPLAPAPPQLPPQPAEPTPEVEPASQTAPAPQEPARAATPFWQEALPWLALLLTLLILGGLIVVILRRLEALAAQQNAPMPAPTTDDSTAVDEPLHPVDIPALRADLQRSRSVLNRTLRRWVLDDPQSLAPLVRMLGPEILTDLRRDPELRPALEEVSAHVAALDGGVDLALANATAERARSRYDAQFVISESTGDADWEFLEGLTLGQISLLLDETSRRERSFVLTRLSPVYRARYLEQLDASQRRQLLLDAGDSQSLSRTESRELAGRLRRAADEFVDAGSEAAGRAAVIVEMIQAMGSAEQDDVVRDLMSNQPDVAQAVLTRICLESTLAELPSEILGDALHRLPLEPLVAFLQDTEATAREHLLAAAPASRRQAIATELSLDIPSTRADFLDARQALSAAVLSTARRNGYDMGRFNIDSLRRTGGATSPREAEVAQ